MTAQLNERQLTAYHEAGHGAMALWLGSPFKSMSIVGDESSEGRVITQVCRRFRPDLDWDWRYLPYIECEVQCLLAGPEAERRVAGASRPGR